MSSNSSEIGKETHHNCPSPSEDEDESLSLCDLPLIDHDKQGESETIKLAAKSGSEDFDFGSVAASLDVLETEMCAADEVFFRGQILPFRHSISSVPTSSVNLNFSRSESMDRNAGSRFQAASSTASSSRSSSTRSTASTGKLPNPICQKRESSQIRNQFHSFPSPRPYARASIAHRSNKTRSGTNPVFRLGLVRTPQIEIQDLKLRFSKQSSSLSRNSSSGGSENGKSVRKKMKKKKKEWSLMSCKCTADVVEPEKVVVKAEEKNEVSSSRHYRTFEWLKDLSHAVVLNDDSRLLN